MVLASEGYPGAYEKGKPIRGLKPRQAALTKVFHAGTEKAGSDIVTAGGRVLGVTTLAETLEAARVGAYQASDKISYEGKIFRKDIGAKALAVAGGSR